MPDARRSTVDALAAFDVWKYVPQQRQLLDHRVVSSVGSESGAIAASLRRLVDAGGKRLRPALTLTLAHLLAKQGGSLPPTDIDAERRRRERALELAAAVELMHSATLIHDDLIDGASSRRGAPTVNAEAGHAAAIVAGDALIAASFAAAASVDAGAVSTLARTLAELCEGEQLEDSLRFDASASPEQLLRVIGCKSGSLIRTACELGAYAAGAGADVIAAAARFGLRFGIVLQLVDDLVDIVSTAALAGKPVGADFAAGVMTLPAAITMRSHPELAALCRPDLDHDERLRSVALLRSPDTIETTIRIAATHAADAGHELAGIAAADPRIADVASWPSRYLWHQLTACVSPELAHLVPVDELVS